MTHKCRKVCRFCRTWLFELRQHKSMKLKEMPECRTCRTCFARACAFLLMSVSLLKLFFSYARKYMYGMYGIPANR